MEIFFYQMQGIQEVWFTNFNGAVLADWCAENKIRYSTQYHDGVRIGIKLLDEKDRTYFHLRWGSTPSRIEEYID